MALTAALISREQFLEVRARVNDEARRSRRPYEIRAEKLRLEARKRTPILQLLSDEEVARLCEVAPGLMRDVNRFRKD